MSGMQVDVVDRGGSRRWWVLGVAVLAQLMDIMDTTIVNIALPSAQLDLGFSDAQRQWIVTGYALTFGALLLTGGRLTDLLGPKRTLLIGLSGFALASATGGAAQSFGVLVTARVLQGAFGALITPAALSLLAANFTGAAERRRAFALFGGITGAGAAVGLIAGGFLTQHLSWRWGLYVNLPIAVTALIAGIVVIRTRPSADRPSLNLPSALVAAVGLGALVFGTDRAGTDGWGDGGTIALIAGAVVVLALFVLMQARSAQPLLPLRITADRSRAGALLLLTLSSPAVFSVFLFLVYYLQEVLHFTPVQSGTAFLPLLVGLAAGVGAASTPLIIRLPIRLVFLGGAVVAAAGLLLLTRLTPTGQYLPDVLPALLVVGFGIGPVFALGVNIATTGVDRRDTGVASALASALQQIGGALGIALLNTIATDTTTDRLQTGHARTLAQIADATTAGFAQAFLAGAVILLVAGALTTLVMPRTMRPPTRSDESERHPARS